MNNDTKCDCNVIHNEKVEQTISKMPLISDIQSTAKVFKVLGDNTRMSIMIALLHGELCVCDISAIINMTISAVSHQLAVLRKHKLVKSRKEGREVFYSLNDYHVSDIVKEMLAHTKHC